MFGLVKKPCWHSGQMDDEVNIRNFHVCFTVLPGFFVRFRPPHYKLSPYCTRLVKVWVHMDITTQRGVPLPNPPQKVEASFSNYDIQKTSGTFFPIVFWWKIPWLFDQPLIAWCLTTMESCGYQIICLHLQLDWWAPQMFQIKSSISLHQVLCSSCPVYQICLYYSTVYPFRCIECTLTPVCHVDIWMHSVSKWFVQWPVKEPEELCLWQTFRVFAKDIGMMDGMEGGHARGTAFGWVA